jgi:hypothetical protein
VFNDKQSVTADPTDADLVFARLGSVRLPGERAFFSQPHGSDPSSTFFRAVG